MHVFLAHIDGGLSALVPTNQELGNHAFYEAVLEGKRSVQRTAA